MIKVKTIHLLAINGILWTAIGIKIAAIGIGSYCQTGCSSALIWIIPLSALVFAGFYVMFTGIVRKYSERIMSMPDEKTSIFRTFSIKGYLIIAFMISLGIGLKHIPGIPGSFFAWFYSGLGSGLLSAGIRFLLRWYRERKALPFDRQ
jgi:hypothetical protein